MLINKFDSLNRKLQTIVGNHDELYFKKTCVKTGDEVSLSIIKNINSDNFKILNNFTSLLTKQLVLI